MPNKTKKNTKKKTPNKKTKKPKEEQIEVAVDEVDEVPVFTDEIDELNYALCKAQAKLGLENLEVMDVAGKGRGIIALSDIEPGKVLLRDVPLAGAIYGDETMAIPFGFQPGVKNTHSFFPCAFCFRFHVQRTKQDAQNGSFCSWDCKKEYENHFGRVLNSVKAKRAREEILSVKNTIKDSEQFIKVIKTCKTIMRMVVLKKTNPEQWRRVMQLDGTCNNSEVLLDAKKWMPFLLKAFRIIIPDLTLEDVTKTFLLAYVNSWGFHIPGPDPNSKGVINGVGLYYIGSMCNHSCDPNAAFVASCVNYEKELVAMKPIRAGDEITCAYINCEGNRRERQKELTFGWNFVCTCDRCNDEKNGSKAECEAYLKSYEDQLEMAMRYEATNERKAKQRRTISAFMSEI